MNAKIYRALAQSAIIFAFGVVSPALAQDATPSTTAKWRPKDGIYVVAGKTIAERCADSTEFYVDLYKKSVGGNEWSCKVGKLTDTDPGTIRLDMTCSDYNLAEDLKKPEDTEFKEVMLLKKMDGASMLVRKTVGGKFKDPEWKAVYCPKDAQQMYRDSIAENQAKREQEKAAAKTAWQPRDGVYASAGADFDDRCLKSGDAVVRLAQKAVSIGAISCYVSYVSVQPPNSVTLNVNCGAQAVVRSDGSIGGSNSAESVTLTKTDDQSVLFRRSRDGQAVGAEQQLRYCPDSAQRAHAESNK